MWLAAEVSVFDNSTVSISSHTLIYWIFKHFDFHVFYLHTAALTFPYDVFKSALVLWCRYKIQKLT